VRMMVMTVMAAAYGLRQILDVRKLAALRSGREIVRKRGEFARGRRIALRCRGLGRALQIGGDLLGDALVLAGVVLLELLERAQHLGERRKLAAVWSRRCGTNAAQTVAVLIVGHAGALQRVVQNILYVVVREIVDWARTHDYTYRHA